MIADVKPRMGAFFLVVILIIAVMPGCVKPLENTNTEATTAGVETTIPIGTNLDSEVHRGTGNAWSGGITVSDTTLTVGVLARDTPFSAGHTILKTGEPCLKLRGVFRNDGSSIYWMHFWAEGYDSGGKQVSWTIGAIGPLEGIEDIDLLPGETKPFELTINSDRKIQRVEINANVYDPTWLKLKPNPAPIPASGLYEIVFSKTWFLTNDKNTNPNAVNISFIEDWLTNAPPVLAGDDTVTLIVPRSQVRDIFNVSNTPGVVTLLLQNSFSKGFPRNQFHHHPDFWPNRN